MPARHGGWGCQASPRVRGGRGKSMSGPWLRPSCHPTIITSSTQPNSLVPKNCTSCVPGAGESGVRAPADECLVRSPRLPPNKAKNQDTPSGALLRSPRAGKALGRSNSRLLLWAAPVPASAGSRHTSPTRSPQPPPAPHSQPSATGAEAPASRGHQRRVPAPEAASPARAVAGGTPPPPPQAGPAQARGVPPLLCRLSRPANMRTCAHAVPRRGGPNVSDENIKGASPGTHARLPWPAVVFSLPPWPCSWRCCVWVRVWFPDVWIHDTTAPTLTDRRLPAPPPRLLPTSPWDVLRRRQRRAGDA